MGRKIDRYLAISCYRCATESFRACRITGFSNVNRNTPIYKAINLSYDERKDLGYLCICNSPDKAIAQLKHILRAREKKEQLYKMGFWIHDGKNFVHLQHGLRFKQYDLSGTFNAYRELKQAMTQDEWKIPVSTTVKLDGHYKPIKDSETEGFMLVDSKKPVIIALKEAA